MLPEVEIPPERPPGYVWALRSPGTELGLGLHHSHSDSPHRLFSVHQLFDRKLTPHKERPEPEE